MIPDREALVAEGASKLLPLLALCSGIGALLLLTLPHYLLPVFHGCLPAYAYTILAVSGDIPVCTILLPS